MISSSTSANAEARAAVGGDDARRARAIARRSASRKPHAACASALVRRVRTCMAMQPCLAGGTSTLSANANVATRGVSAAACGDPWAPIRDVAPWAQKCFTGRVFGIKTRCE